MEANELGLLLPVPTASDDKYTRGTVGFVTGSDAYPGAALLGIAGAQATSPGFVRYVGPRRVSDLVLVSHPEVVVSEQPAGPAQAWVLGSGVAPNALDQLANIRSVLAKAEIAVIDAGALDLVGITEFAIDSNHIMVPHQGELCRLLNRLLPSRLWHPEQLDDADFAFEAAKKAAESSGMTVLLKGAKRLLWRRMAST